MDEVGDCERCGEPYPWSGPCKRVRRSGRRRSEESHFARWLAIEEHTRAALGTTPVGLSERIELVMGAV
jgi:hypothetical protein